MAELVRTREELEIMLSVLIDQYKNHKDLLGMNHNEAKARTLALYDDYYEWLQGDLE